MLKSRFLIIFFFNFLICSLHGEKNVLAFSGSLREDSLNTQLVKEAAEIAKKMGANITLIQLKDYPLPFYNEDLENQSKLPKKANDLRNLMISSDVIFIASPEYNASISGVLKNTLDWLTRNENGEGSRDAFKGKKFLIMSASPGSSGGSRGLTHLETIISAVGGEVLPVKITIKNAHEAFNEKGQLKNPTDRKELENAVKSAL